MNTAHPLRYARGMSGAAPFAPLHVKFARLASLIFLLNTLYPVTVKLMEQRLGHDWLHSLLHLACAVLGAHAGWMSRRATAARAFTWFVGAAYLGLALLGWFVPGLFLHTPFAIPLAPADNVFHLGLGGFAALVSAFELLRAARRR